MHSEELKDKKLDKEKYDGLCARLTVMVTVFVMELIKKTKDEYEKEFDAKEDCYLNDKVDHAILDALAGVTAALYLSTNHNLPQILFEFSSMIEEARVDLFKMGAKKEEKKEDDPISEFIGKVFNMDSGIDGILNDKDKKDLD